VAPSTLQSQLRLALGPQRKDLHTTGVIGARLMRSEKKFQAGLSWYCLPQTQGRAS
jgi:hypothetical protein